MRRKKEEVQPSREESSSSAGRAVVKQQPVANGNTSKPQTSELANTASNGSGTGNGVGEIARSPQSEIKVLLLGSGESGKSTILKQMKIIHQNGFTQKELFDYKPFVFKNIDECVKCVLQGLEKFELEPKLQKLTQEDLKYLENYEVSMDADDSFDPEFAGKIRLLLDEPETKSLLMNYRHDFYLMDSAFYFFENLDRITAQKYLPSATDVLRTRKQTSGIFDMRFSMGGLNIHMYDVGGQRSERKKWIHCFDNVTLIMFCVALSEYDQVLLEADGQNRLEESLILFDSVVNSRWFTRTSVVLFLNKIDVFAEKLPNSPLEKHFPDYTGGDDINKAAKYILWRFNQVNRANLNIYPHVTQATDTSNIKVVFNAVKETIMENSLKDTGIL